MNFKIFVMIIYLLLQVYRLPTCMRKDNCCVTSAYISPIYYEFIVKKTMH